MYNNFHQQIKAEPISNFTKQVSEFLKTPENKTLKLF